MQDFEGKKKELLENAKKQTKKAIRKARSAHPIKKLKAKYKHKLAADGICESAYSNAAAISWTVAIISIVAIIIFILGVAIFGGKDVSLDGMYYLYRDVNSMGSVGSGENTRLDYTIPKKNQDFALFKNGLCVAGDTDIQIFNKTGNQTMSVSTNCSDPEIAASNEYIVVYDIGGKSFYAYNSFAEIYSEKRDFPISRVAIADNGKLCVVGQSQSYNCEVTVYDDSFKREFTYSRNDYAIDCDFDSDGRNIALCSLTSSGGEYLVTLTLLDTKKQEVKAQLEIDGVLPYECHYIGNDRIALICSDRVQIYNERLDLKGEYRFPNLELEYMSVSSDGIALMFVNDRIKGQSTVVVIDSRAKEKMEYEYTGDSSDMALFGGYIYIAENGGVLRVDCSFRHETYAPIESSGGKLIICDKDRVILARESVAHVISSFGAK